VPSQVLGLDRFEAREIIVQMLRERKLLEKVEPHRHAVRHCYRCETVVEPRLSDQWFVQMKPLAEPALDAYRSGAVRLVPERWGGTYENWMGHIRDWNISRQLWWGHRIPVFSCTKCRHQWADRQDPQSCPKCGGKVEQDPDVLDTWFSSWLWPFATFGWPEQTPDLKRFYPGHTLVTGPDIIFFWVARMIMAGYHFMGDKPFANVYLTGRWVLSRTQGAIRVATASLEQCRLAEAASGCFDFVWKELADWYVEAVQPRLGAGAASTPAAAAQAVLSYCFDAALRLLHPVVPFITEDLWQKLPGRQADDLLAIAAWPRERLDLHDPKAEPLSSRIQEAITEI